MNRIIAMLVALVLASLELGAASIDNLNLHVFVKNLNHAIPPLVEDGWLVLTATGPHRFVGAAFEHEGFAIIHPFEVNDRGVFVLAWRIPVDFAPELAYRLDIDGAWVADPNNPRRSTFDTSGSAVSLVSLPPVAGDVPGLYKILGADGRTAHFLFKGPSGESVSVAGSFNNWDPFTHKLAEISPGVYELEVALPPGLNLYCFVWRGQMLSDPLNQEKASDRYDRVVSVLRVGAKPMPGDPLIAPMPLGKTTPKQ